MNEEKKYYFAGGMYGDITKKRFHLVSPPEKGALPYCARTPEGLLRCKHHAALFVYNKETDSLDRVDDDRFELNDCGQDPFDPMPDKIYLKQIIVSHRKIVYEAIIRVKKAEETTR